MKRFYLCLFLFSFVFLNYVFAQEIDVFLTGMSNQTSKAYAETNISKLINAINISFNLKQPLNLNGVNISPEAAKSLDMLWDTSVFHCVEDEIVEEALIIGLRGEYEVRNIPFLFEDLDEDEIADYITANIEGNSLIAAGDEDMVKIHFHTNEPWKILEYCNTVGEIYDIVVEDMIRQANGQQG